MPTKPRRQWFVTCLSYPGKRRRFCAFCEPWILLVCQAPGVACTGQSRLLFKPRRPSWIVLVQKSRRSFFTCMLRGVRGFSCLAGLALALQRWHRLQRLACIARRWVWCSACIGEASGRTAREWCSACVVRLDPCSSSDVPTRTPSQSRSKSEFVLFGVGFLCCIPNA